MSVLKCIVADDEPLAVRLLESYIARTPQLQAAGSYGNGRDALEAVRRDAPDLAFLDIQMPDMTGLELARALEGLPTRVVFVTAYRDYALEGFRVNALDYLLKPVSYDEFARSVRRALDARPAPAPSVPAAPPHITVRSDYRSVRLPLDQIVYVEGLKDYVKIYLTDAERPVITQMTLKAVEALLPAERFVRVHRSYIVSAQHVRAADRGCLTVGPARVPVGSTYRHRLAELL